MLQNGALDVLNALVEATYARQPAALLRPANLGLERLRFLFRLTLDLRLLDPRRYEAAARSIAEICGQNGYANATSSTMSESQCRSR